MATVFISYAREDESMARRLADDLRRLGHEPSIFSEQDKPGASIPQLIEAAIVKSHRFLVLLSEAALASAWVRQEIDCALMLANDRDTSYPEFIVPVFLEHVRAPLLLRPKFSVDLYPPSYYHQSIEVLDRRFRATDNLQKAGSEARSNRQPAVVDRKPIQSLSELGFTVMQRGAVEYILGVDLPYGRETKEDPLRWAPPWPFYYPRQPRVLEISGPNGGRVALPHSIEIDGRDFQESEIALLYSPTQFLPGVAVPNAWRSYERNVPSAAQNRPQARLQRWSPAERLLTFETVNYVDYVATNLALDVRLGNVGSIREIDTDDGALAPLSSSKLANVAGLNVHVATRDGCLIFRKRTSRVIVRPGELCSAISTTISREDIKAAAQANEPSLADLSFLLPLAEELGCDEKEVVERRFLGLGRELVRGGLPDFFYAIRLSVTASEVLSRHALNPKGELFAVELSAPKNPSDFWSALSGIALHCYPEGGPRLSVPLITNLALWWQSQGYRRTM